MASATTLYVILARENKLRSRMELDEDEKDRLAFKDLTDKENKHFRYAL